MPEPWATRLVKEGGGKILVNEADLWPKGKFVTTDLVVTTEVPDAHPDVVKQLIEGELAAIDLIKTNPHQGRELVVAGHQKATGKAIAARPRDRVVRPITFTLDPIARRSLKDAKDAAGARASSRRRTSRASTTSRSSTRCSRRDEASPTDRRATSHHA